MMNFIIEISKQFLALVDIEKKKVLDIVKNDEWTNSYLLKILLNKILNILSKNVEKYLHICHN